MKNCNIQCFVTPAQVQLSLCTSYSVIISVISLLPLTQITSIVKTLFPTHGLRFSSVPVFRILVPCFKFFVNSGSDDTGLLPLHILTQLNVSFLVPGNGCIPACSSLSLENALVVPITKAESEERTEDVGYDVVIIEVPMNL